MNRKISLELDKEIYRKDIICRAITDYSHICKIELKERRDRFICIFSKSKASLEMTVYEFGNYLVELSNVRISEI